MTDHEVDDLGGDLMRDEDEGETQKQREDRNILQRIREEKRKQRDKQRSSTFIEGEENIPLVSREIQNISDIQGEESVTDESYRNKQRVKKAEKYVLNLYPDSNFDNVSINITENGEIYISILKDPFKNESLKKKSKKFFVKEDGTFTDKDGKKANLNDTLKKSLGDSLQEKLKKSRGVRGKIQLEKEKLEKEGEIEENNMRQTEDKFKKYQDEIKMIKKKLDIKDIRLDEYHKENTSLRDELNQKEDRFERVSKDVMNIRKELEIKLRNNEEEIRGLRELIDKSENETENERDQLNNLNNIKNEIRENINHLSDIEGEIRSNKQLFNEYEDRLDGIEREIIEKNNILEEINTEREVIVKRLNWKQKIKEIFKEHGFSITAIVLSIGTIITSVVFKVTSTVSSGLKTLKDLVISYGKELAQIIPGIIGAIANFIFKAAGSVLGFLSKYSWLLILFIVTIFIEKFTSKKK